MRSQTLAATGPVPSAVPTAGAVRRLPPSIILGLISAALLALSFPGERDEGWPWLAWFALTPLLALVASDRRPIWIYSGAWIGGLAFWLASIRWILWCPEDATLGWLAMAVALSAWWPAFLALTRLAVRRLGVPLMLAVPVIWVALEFVQGYAFTGFSWYYLAHSQYRFLPFIQVADFAGAWGPSFVLALANATWVVLLTPTAAPASRPWRPRIAAAAVLGAAVAGSLGYGVYRLQTASFRPGPKVSLLQSDLVQKMKMRKGSEEIRALYERLVIRALKDAPDLIVWPETSWPVPVTSISPKLSLAALDRLVKTRHADDRAEDWQESARFWADYLQRWVNAIRTPMLLGAISYHYREGRLDRYNSAVLVAPDRKGVQSYHKLHLVPFGEYVPLIDMMPWLAALTPYSPDNLPNLAFGTDAVGFTLGKYTYATVICFEDTVPRVARRFFAEAAPGKQPDVLLNQSNDGWFRGSSEPDMHLAISVFRAVENRVPLARAANTGISAWVDGSGRIREVFEKSKEGVLTAKIFLDDRESFYTARGDWLPLLCLIATGGLILFAAGRSLRRLLRCNQVTPLAHPPSVG